MIHASAARRADRIWADALFVSMLQRSDDPSPDQVRHAIVSTVDALGGQGCADLVAQEFGDHPEVAAPRMQWARSMAEELFRSSVLRPSGG